MDFWIYLLTAAFIRHSLAVEFLGVEKVYPAIATQKRSADMLDPPPPPSITVHIAKHRLNLELNSNLVSPFFVSHYEDGHGEDAYIKGHMNCFYHGSVEGHPDWHVAVSTCKGLRGIFGDPGNRHNYYYIEPTSEGNSMAQAHALYTGYSEGNTSCGVCSKQDKLTSLQKPILPPSFSHHNRVRRQGGMRIVEWVMVNDLAQYEAYGRNLTAVVLRNLEIANLVDSFYRVLSIRVTVVFTTTWTQGNKIDFPSDNNLDTLLDRFSRYESAITVEHDSAMLITAENLPGNTLGYAYVGTMCRDQLSVGLMEDGNKRFLGTIATIAAHELGHIFNMRHDNGSTCSCSDSSGRCIMAATTISPPATMWSSCSVSYLMDGYRNNLDRCLLNVPGRTLEDPSCGNGIREGDEACDCGSVEECTDKCCEPLTCRLTVGARCNVGGCCSESCQFLPQGTVCRNASNECDIVEYCGGDVSRCPRDVHKQDTSPCNGQQNYCYAGSCPTRDDQCNVYFGSRSAPSICYSSLNVRGISSGNCGTSSTQYLPCPAEHVTCGKVQCEEGTFNRSQLSFNYFPTTFRLTSGRCYSFTRPPGSDTFSLGLVQEGTKCGNESLCLAQRCTGFSALTYIKPCPVGSNNLTCAGAGICNNLNECSCELGLEGAVCEQNMSPGGSSGGNLSGGDIAGIFFGLLLGLALAGGVAALIMFVVYRQRNKSPSYKSTSKPTSSSNPRPSKTPSYKKSTPPYKPPPKATPSKPLPRATPSKPLPRATPSKPLPKTVPSGPFPASKTPPKPTPSKPPTKTPPKPVTSRPPPKPAPSRPQPKASPSPGSAKPSPRWPPGSTTTSQPSQPLHSMKTPGKKPPPPRPPAPKC